MEQIENLSQEVIYISRLSEDMSRLQMLDAKIKSGAKLNIEINDVFVKISCQNTEIDFLDNVDFNTKLKEFVYGYLAKSITNCAVELSAVLNNTHGTPEDILDSYNKHVNKFFSK